LAMITAIGGIAMATADITTAAVTEYSRTTAQARTNPGSWPAVVLAQPKATAPHVRPRHCVRQPRPSAGGYQAGGASVMITAPIP
jgi:hypothetical protein